MDSARSLDRSPSASMTPTSSPGLRGVIPIIPTPFRVDESFDLAGLARCVRFAIDCGVSAICLPAYASEFYKLTESERLQVITTALEASEGQLPVIAQADHPSARVAAELGRMRNGAGVTLPCRASSRCRLKTC